MYPEVIKNDNMTSYVGRCLKDKVMKVLFPDIKERREVAKKQWKDYCRNKHGNKKKQA
jgi:hypothetical protein